MFARSKQQLLLSASLLVSSGVMSACDKQGATEKPGENPAAPTDSGLVLKYSDQKFQLKETMKVSLSISGAANVEMSAEAVGRLEVAPHEGGRLMVRSMIDDLVSFKASGDAADAGVPSLEEVEAEVKKDISLVITNRLGDTDDEATKALPENVAKRAEAKKRAEAMEAESKAAGPEKPKSKLDARDLGLSSFLGLPDLPRAGVEQGKPRKLERQADERSVFGALTVPVEVDYTYTLRSVDGTIATVDIKIEGTGATELDGEGGKALISYLEESDVTVVFDTASGTPRSVKGYRSSEINIEAQGQTQKIEQTYDIDATYEAID